MYNNPLNPLNVCKLTQRQDPTNPLKDGIVYNNPSKPSKERFVHILTQKQLLSKYLSSLGLVVATGGAAGADIFLRGGAE